MQFNNLGSTGLKVSRVCLGTNMFGAGYVDDARAISVIRSTLEHGINFVDTADAYHDGLSEVVVGKAVKSRRHDYVIATKGHFPTGKGVNDRGSSRKHLVDAIESSLRRLGTEYIDLYQVHGWDTETPIEETLKTLDDFVRKGHIRYIGCSNFTGWQLAKSLWASDKLGLERFESIQPAYNFGERFIEHEVFPLCLDQKVSVLPYQILMGGLLAGSYKRDQDPPSDSHMASRHAQGAKGRYWDDARFTMAEKVKTLAGQIGCEPTQLVIAWTLSKPAIASSIIGASRPQQVQQNAMAAEIKLPQDVLEELEKLR